MIAAVLLALSLTGPVHAPASSPLPFADLRSPVAVTTRAHAVTFAVPLSAAELGGVPQRLRAHLELLRPTTATAPSLVQVRINDTLFAASALTDHGVPEAVDVDVPAAFVGTTNALRITVDAPGTTLLGASTFSWVGVVDAPATIADWVKIAHGRVLALVDPAFRPAAAHVVSVLGAMNSSIARIDVEPFDGTRISDGYDGYDEVLVFAPPAALASFDVPLRGGAAPFRIVNPISNAVLVGEAQGASAATIQTGRIGTLPLLAFSYVGEPAAIDRLAHLTAADLAVQVGNVSLVAHDGVTAYETGPKLRIYYAADDRLAHGWEAIRFPLALALLTAIVAGGLLASRTLARKPVGRMLL